MFVYLVIKLKNGKRTKMKQVLGPLQPDTKPGSSYTIPIKVIKVTSIKNFPRAWDGEKRGR